MNHTAQEVMIIARELANSGALHKMDILSRSRLSLGLQVFLVEDDEADAYFIRRALAKNPWAADVVIAEDGVEALELFDKRRIAPQLAIVDLHAPRKDGLAVLTDLQAGPCSFRLWFSRPPRRTKMRFARPNAVQWNS